MYHPAAALRTASIERESFEDVARVPETLVRARERRAATGPGAEAPPAHAAGPASEPASPTTTTSAAFHATAPADEPASTAVTSSPAVVPADPAADDASQLTLF
jgi:hypothetical protein